jgi:hypothetical protein
MALQFRFFLANDFSLLLLLFWLFSLAMTSYAYMLSAFVRKPQVRWCWAVVGGGWRS